MLRKSLKIAIASLRKNKLRTGLAMLGMMIGVAAVLTMFALGTGAQGNVSNEVRSAGTTLLFVRAGNYTRGGEELKIASGLGSANTLTPGDADAIRAMPGVAYASPLVRARTWVNTSSDKQFTQVYGVDADYYKMYDWDMEKGRFFKSSAVDNAENVAVIGSALRDQLFPDENPVGKQIEIHGTTFTVKGFFSSNDEDQAAMVVVPYTALQKLLNVESLNQVTVAAAQAGDASQIALDIVPLLRERHSHTHQQTSAAGSLGLGGLQGSGAGGGVPDDFTVKTQASEALTKGLNTSVAAFILANMPQMDQVNLQEMSGTLSRAGQTMTALLAAIATISLIVGGIGIMNIMLMSVTERTREIGIRRAVGARSRDVLMQFLVEAVTLGIVGGACGILLGFLVSLLVTKVMQWPADVSLNAVALSFGVAAATGVFFGFYPARRASKLNPIDALRFE
ncbi:putative ABC transport system permease protein/macrolide transport system ATP-binding/permease protein [Bryocella elongata]|uniref:Putative ABC transport system permease protein/macrolide transport system ATP-binding/permease protein n=1 Tax=Bryocella elongata TaxID=863522 RepID=A0A1H5ZEM8_9BACT|nr:ABC transporter permease [Bryocella elongata]SEG34953.1 putative ABC transport system permease protein/macrolide transport system ATP-binding/permease protein [Bryocella elongata]